MNLFGKPKKKDDVGLRSHLVLEETKIVDKKTFDTDPLAVARQSVHDFNRELKESASRQQAALNRVDSLNKLISNMELDLKNLRRLEEENKDLNRTVLETESKLAQKSSWASELDSKYTDLERRHSDMRENLETAKAKLAAARDQELTLESRIGEQEQSIRTLTNRSETAEDQQLHTQQSLDKLREALDGQSAELAQRNREGIELKNNLDELGTKFDRKSKQADATIVELKNLRLDYNELKTRHVELNGTLENTKYDLRTQKNVFDETVKRREEENLALKTRIDQLETQVRIKENMSTHLDQEFITLRNELLNERDRCSSLETRLRTKSEEVDRSGGALAKAKIEYEELNAKFAATIEDFETMRKINQMQREKLERYASLGGVTVGQAVLNMDINPIDRDAPVYIPEDSENVMRLKPKKG